MSEQIKWLRDGQTIYSLMHNGWRKGEETFRNRFYFHVYADGECAPAEVEIVVAGIYAALNNAAEIAAQADARIAELEDVIREGGKLKTLNQSQKEKHHGFWNQRILTKI